MAVNFDEEMSRRSYGKPYTGKHPIPTIQGYREHRAELKERLQDTHDAQEEEDEQNNSRLRRAYDSIKSIAKDEDKEAPSHDPYPTANRYALDRPKRQQGHDNPLFKQQEQNGDENEAGNKHRDQEAPSKSATEAATSHIDPKQKRKDMKNINRTGGGREVTDPVTHLPVVIHDSTDRDLGATTENHETPGFQARTDTGLSGASKSQNQLNEETRDIHKYHTGLQKVFPPPDFHDTKQEMMKTYKHALTFGLTSILGLTSLALGIISILHSGSERSLQAESSWLGRKTSTRWRPISWLSTAFVIAATTSASFALITGVSGWLNKKVDEIFEDEVWDAARQEEIDTNQSEHELPESVAWLNSLLSSVWPLINPDLFASLIDTLEDVMQASLPRVIRMVSVDDLGQGSEAIRILGIRWLPTGAASQSVDVDGKLQSADDQEADQVTNTGDKAESRVDEKEAALSSQGAKETMKQEQEAQPDQQTGDEGMEAEEGDFVNVELAFAYRARSSGKSIRDKAKNAHLYLKFYLPGGIAVPVWVELRGLIGTMRMRLQLTPDPPFFSLCTLTFLGQPRATLSCVPLSKRSLNIMDVPLISSFVQSAIDAAFAEYVAPKSLTLDLKDMLMGDDFKKDTGTRGVVLVYIKQARGFKEGDGGVGPLKGSSDSYVTLSWGKFGKPVASTRIIEGSQEPNWHEWHSILVTPDEINAEEDLRVQIWDSDKMTADDDLGRVELDLKSLMKSSRTRNQMYDREDEFTAEDPDEKMPGTLTWSVGYFSKTHIQQCQIDKQTINKEIHNIDELKRHVSETAKSKLREATIKDESRELEQQTREDFKELEDSMIASAPPPDGFPSGILSIQIHNVTGLEISKLNNEEKSGTIETREDEAEHSENLPDSYCTIVLNHKKIYRTRTKPKNSKPFFNAGTEKFIKDWRSAEVMISVRDNREKENDPLLGLIYLPLRKVFEKRSQVMQSYPLAGGIGYGRARVSMVWRSLQLQMPKELMGWDYCTMEIQAPVRVKSGGEQMNDLKAHKIKLRSNLGKAKMRPKDSGSSGEWWPTKSADDGSIFLPVRRRYQSALVIEFRRSSILSDSTPAFAILWLHDVLDEEEQTIVIRVWKGGKDNLRRAESCCDYTGLEQDEQSLGEVELSLRLWRGLSGYHKTFAEKAQTTDVRDVIECLDTVNDEKMGTWDESSSISDGDIASDSDSDTDNDINAKENVEDAQKRKKLRKFRSTDSSDDSSSDEEGERSPVKTVKKLPAKVKEQASSLVEAHKDSDDDGSRGIRGQIQDYKDHHKQLHRKHRGVMQWQSARTLDWMVGKAKRAKGRIEGAFEHGEKGQGIETEV